MSRLRSYIPFLHRRSFIMFGLQIVGFGTLASRLYYLQYLEVKKYKKLSSLNRLKIDIIAPRRGDIIDVDGDTIASSKRVFRLQILKNEFNDFILNLDNLRLYIKITDEEYERIIAQAKHAHKYTSILVKENISWREMAKVQVNKNNLFGVNILEGETRYYKYKDLFSHVIGYVGKISQRDKKYRDDPLQFVPGFEIGKSGLERSYEGYLRGSAGAEQTEVNVKGQIVSAVKNIPPTRGEDLQITINKELQLYIKNLLLQHRSASMVVMNIKNGDIKAMVSQPSFDANLFVGGISNKNWEELKNNKYGKLMNKVMSGQYAPGSAFKMIVALTALKYNALEGEKLFCSGDVEISGQKYHCWKTDGHGKVGLIKSLRESCDVWYYNMSLKVGIDNIAKMAKKFGLGEFYDFNLSPQENGLIPTKKWKKINKNRSWYIGDTVISSIGQGYVLTTPLQLAVMTARIASGKEVVPRISKITPNKEPYNIKFKKIDVNEEHLNIIRKGMYEVVNHYRGTARNYQTYGWNMAGKTGTSQVRTISLSERESEDGIIKNENLQWKYRDHALFVAYAPVENPKYAISCVVEHGGSGAVTATPLVRDVLNKMYELENLL